MNYNNLFKRMIDLNMSKKELCECSGVSKATVSRLKSGKPVSMSNLIKIADAVGMELDDLVARNR